MPLVPAPSSMQAGTVTGWALLRVRMHTARYAYEVEASWRLKLARAKRFLVELRKPVYADVEGRRYRNICPEPLSADSTDWALHTDVAIQTA
jgi:hypothetical protein